jgi:chemotaxis protein CheD
MMVEKLLSDQDLREYYLYPGDVFCSKIPHVVHTILGSCVAVYLWDPVLQFGGINHFMLPANDNGANFKYGSAAIPQLIRTMVQLGSTKSSLKAKIFGGADMVNRSTVFNIGSRNISLAQEILRKEGIPILSFSVGGGRGRKVIVYTGSGQVFISQIRQTVEVIDKTTFKSPRK